MAEHCSRSTGTGRAAKREREREIPQCYVSVAETAFLLYSQLILCNVSFNSEHKYGLPSLLLWWKWKSAWTRRRREQKKKFISFVCALCMWLTPTEPSEEIVREVWRKDAISTTILLFFFFYRHYAARYRSYLSLIRLVHASKRRMPFIIDIRREASHWYSKRVERWKIVAYRGASLFFLRNLIVRDFCIFFFRCRLLCGAMEFSIIRRRNVCYRSREEEGREELRDRNITTRAKFEKQHVSGKSRDLSRFSWFTYENLWRSSKCTHSFDYSLER